ncbi:MAG: recombinase [Christensenellales bacterium]
MLKAYRTALYERVSRENGDDETSESIRVQRQMLEDYCRNRADLEIVRHYSDDGYTGVP